MGTESCVRKKSAEWASELRKQSKWRVKTVGGKAGQLSELDGQEEKTRMLPWGSWWRGPGSSQVTESLNVLMGEGKEPLERETRASIWWMRSSAWRPGSSWSAKKRGHWGEEGMQWGWVEILTFMSGKKGAGMKPNILSEVRGDALCREWEGVRSWREWRNMADVPQADDWSIRGFQSRVRAHWSKTSQIRHGTEGTYCRECLLRDLRFSVWGKFCFCLCFCFKYPEGH